MSLDKRIGFDVLRLRYWQHVINEKLKKNAFIVPVHVAVGHESAAVAVSQSMKSGDQLVLTHRNIAYNLARLGSLSPVLQEYSLDRNGLGKGQLGSMNLSNRDLGIPYSSSILGNNFPVACGLALANSRRGLQNAVFVVSGDGAMEEGTFYESLVFARSHRLSVLFCIENNNMSMSSTVDQRRCAIDLRTMAGSFGVEYRSLSGNDPYSYSDILRNCRDAVLADSMPMVIEFEIESFSQHAGPSPGWPTDPKSMSLGNGLQVEASDRDPVYVVKKVLGTSVYEDLEKEILAEACEI